MNAHELIDRFGKKSPGTKLAVGIGVLIAIIVVVVGIFFFGQALGDKWASARYDKKTAENTIKIAKAEAENQRLAGVNDALKKQNEDLAGELIAKDKRRVAEFEEKARQREIDLKQTMAAIDAQSTAPAIICATCEAQRKAGNELSTEFCGQCWKQP